MWHSLKAVVEFFYDICAWPLVLLLFDGRMRG